MLQGYILELEHATSQILVMGDLEVLDLGLFTCITELFLQMKCERTTLLPKIDLVQTSATRRFHNRHHNCQLLLSQHLQQVKLFLVHSPLLHPELSHLGVPQLFRKFVSPWMEIQFQAVRQLAQELLLDGQIITTDPVG